MTENKNPKNFIQNNEIYICGAFDSSIVDILSELRRLIETESKKTDPKITFIINSDGGQTDMLKILLTEIEKAKTLNIVVKTIVHSNAYSAGSILAMSGTKGNRYISEHAQHLIHYGSAGFTAYTPLQLDRNTAYLKEHFEWVKKMYVKYATVKNLNEVILDDNYRIYGQDIIENGLADKFV